MKKWICLFVVIFTCCALSAQTYRVKFIKNHTVDDNIGTLSNDSQPGDNQKISFVKGGILILDKNNKVKSSYSIYHTYESYIDSDNDIVTEFLANDSSKNKVKIICYENGIDIYIIRIIYRIAAVGMTRTLDYYVE